MAIILNKLGSSMNMKVSPPTQIFDMTRIPLPPCAHLCQCIPACRCRRPRPASVWRSWAAPPTCCSPGWAGGRRRWACSWGSARTTSRWSCTPWHSDRSDWNKGWECIFVILFFLKSRILWSPYWFQNWFIICANWTKIYTENCLRVL